MELLQLRYFLTVASLCNITKAAEYHHIPQPAMSKTISKLEHELNVHLFNRERNRLSLTREGELFFQDVRNSISILDTSLERFQNKDSKLRGEITLLAEQHRLTLIDCISSFKKIYPDVTFHTVHKTDQLQSAFDFSITSRAAASKDQYSCVHLLREELRAALPLSHPLARRTSISLSELQDEYFFFTSSKSSVLEIVSKACAMAGFSPKIGGTYDDLFCIEKSVVSGAGITFVPMLAWRQLFREGVSLLPVTDVGLYRDTFVISAKSRILPLAHEKFSIHLKNYFRNMYEGSLIDFIDE